MYPHINEYVKLLHNEGISTFLVTNAQFPDRIAQMDPVTQLYVSIDASTRDSLKAIDRPLFKDFWQRFLGSLEALKHKEQRTVYRLTLVKSFNMNEIKEYAALVAIGRPTFIEIKGVTYCGKNNASNLTMKNVPFHEEVRQFSQALLSYLDGSYDLACEHVHSCCILIADKRLRIDGKWHTWINYAKFLQLQKEWYRSGAKFTALDYCEETPEWAVYGAQEGGFNPVEKRWKRKAKVDKKKDDTAKDGTLSTPTQFVHHISVADDAKTTACCNGSKVAKDSNSNASSNVSSNMSMDGCKSDEACQNGTCGCANNQI